MRWETKALALAFLSRVPFGRRVYRRLQDWFGTSRLDIDEQYQRKIAILRRLRRHTGGLSGLDYLEIGTGWHPVLPLLFSLAGAKSVTTIDLNPWLTGTSLDETLVAIASIADRIEHDLDVPAEQIRSVAGALRSVLAAGADIPDTLRNARIRYLVPVNGADTGLPDGSFDTAVSTNLLEHVPEDGLVRMQRELRRIVRPGGLVLHHVNPGDHFATDPRITTINFLRFSPRVWYWIGGSGLAYHNRLRCTDYAEIMSKTGFAIEERESLIDNRALEALRTHGVKPGESFVRYSDTELCAYVTTIVARVPA